MTLHDVEFGAEHGSFTEDGQDAHLDNGHQPTSGGQWRLNLEVKLSYADFIKSTEWATAIGPWNELIDVLLDHQEQATKDGPCFVPGRLLGTQRQDVGIAALALAVLDLDGGEDINSIRQKIEASGYEAVIYSTHSHLTTRSTVRLAGYRKFTGEDEVKPDLVARYLVQVKRVLPELVKGLRITNAPDVRDENAVIEVEHSPVQKYRVVMPLAQPFSIVDQLRDEMTLQKIKQLWKSALNQTAGHLGLSCDPSCTDLSRAYFLPSHPPGVPYLAEHLRGSPLSLEPFLVSAMAAQEEQERARQSHHSSDVDHVVTDRDGRPRDLRAWDAQYSGTYRMVDVIRASAPGLINELGDNSDDKQHIRCPFEHEHSNPEEGSGTFVANPGRLVDGRTIRTWTIHCRHASCLDRTRLDFLKGLIEQGHLTFTDLTNGEEASDDAAPVVDERIAKYKDKWAVINAGGKVLVFNIKERDLSRALLAEPDFKRLHRYDYSIDQDPRGREVTIYWAEQFIKRPPKGTKFYTNGFCFKPGGNTDPESFNLYRGLHVAAGPSGSCELFRELIFDVWAKSDRGLGEWLWEYFLHLVARPGERVRTSIAIRGSQGAGKSIVFEMMRRIFDEMLLVIDNQNMVLGAFNESLVGKLAVVLEEAAFAGDRSAFQKMKNLITGDTLHINPKHKAPITVENFARVFLISNEEHFVHLEPGDRRYTVIEVSDAWKRTNKYVALLEQWANGGAERFVWEAINHEFRLIPGTQTLVINKNYQTKYAAAQIAQSRDPLQHAIVDLLLRGSFESMRDGTAIFSSDQFYWRMEDEAEIESMLLQTYVRAVMSTLAPHRMEHFTSLRRIIGELERFSGKTKERKLKRKEAVSGVWRSVPICRMLPPRRVALDHAFAGGLITEEEYNAAVARPDEFCPARSRGGAIGLRGLHS